MSTEAVRPVNSPEDFRIGVLEASKTRLVVVKVWAPWCGPCRAITPMVDKLAAEYGAMANPPADFCALDASKYADGSTEYGVASIPAFLFFRNGKMVEKDLSIRTEDTLKKKIASL